MPPAIERPPAASPAGGRLWRGAPAALRRRLAPVSPAALAAGAAVAATAIFFFFNVNAELWLDEALSVNIAQLPLTEIPDALRQDNSAPLHYLLLHLWMEVFGEGNFAARALSGVLVLASVPAVWLAGRRIGGHWAAWTAALLVATSPFAGLYATQARMYGLVILLTALGYLALTSVLDRPTPARVVVLGLVSGLLLLTHYWSFYLLAAVFAVLVASLIRSGRWGRSAGELWAAAGVAGGALLLLPWLPVFLFQLANTGTPWGNPSEYRFLLDIGEYFADTNRARWHLAAAATPGRVLAVLLLVLAGLAALRTRASAAEPEGVETAASRRHSMSLAAVILGTVLLAGTASKLNPVSFESRYLAVVFVPFILLVATGASLVAGRWLRLGVTAALVVLGAIGSADNIDAERSHAPEIAAAVTRAAQPGDVVAYCPDQLAPPVDRLLGPGLRQVTFPTESTPQRVNWVDYAERIQAGDPAAFARNVDRMAGSGHDVWLVWGDGYGAFGDRCGSIARELGGVRPGPQQPIALSRATNYFEPSNLTRFLPRD
ncbi:MAG: glycosyltransferase family 39 protein [Actinomycetota bacterium]|nr:glycosyltransferase family 39 protein [Actinomycetota bacterium]